MSETESMPTQAKPKALPDGYVAVPHALLLDIIGALSSATIPAPAGRVQTLMNAVGGLLTEAD